MQVFTRLQKLLLCTSHKHTIVHIDDLGKDHDCDVRKWMDTITDAMEGKQLVNNNYVNVDYSSMKINL